MHTCANTHTHTPLILSGVRLEENIYTRLERPKPHRSETSELLGAEFGKASSVFGSEASEYGEREREVAMSGEFVYFPPAYMPML